MLGQITARGFTLLEVTLALALSGIVFMGLGYFVTWQGHVTDNRHRAIAESQTARVVLDQIARDLRNVALTADRNNSPATGTSTSNSGGTSAGGNNTNGTDAGATTGSTDGTNSGTSNGSSDSFAATSASSGSSSAVSTTATIMSGIYGTSSQVQIDTHFVPSFLSQLQATQDVSFGLAGPVLPDTQSVLYLVDAPQNATPALGVASAAPATPHLLRGAMPQASSTWQMSQGSDLPLLADAQSFAPYVRKIEFWYFDGTQWLTSWDMTVMNSLPIAMQILLWVDADDDSQLEPPAQLRTESSSNSGVDGNSGHVFSLVVSFPVTQVPGSGSSAVTNSEGTGSSTATDSTGGVSSDDGSSDGDGSSISNLLNGDQSSDETPAVPSRQGGGR